MACISAEGLSIPGPVISTPEPAFLEAASNATPCRDALQSPSQRSSSAPVRPTAKALLSAHVQAACLLWRCLPCAFSVRLCLPRLVRPGLHYLVCRKMKEEAARRDQEKGTRGSTCQGLRCAQDSGGKISLHCPETHSVNCAAGWLILIPCSRQSGGRTRCRRT